MSGPLAATYGLEAGVLIAASEAGKRMQVALDNGRLWFIGIPHRGDMAALETLCRQRGLDMKEASWR